MTTFPVPTLPPDSLRDWMLLRLSLILAASLSEYCRALQLYQETKIRHPCLPLPCPSSLQIVTGDAWASEITRSLFDEKGEMDAAAAWYFFYKIKRVLF